MVSVSPWFPILACIMYGVLIVAGQSYFANRPALDFRKAMAVWNFALSAFSFVGVVRVLPAIIHYYYTYSWQENMCFDPESHYGSGSTGLWVQLFILSKFPELFDTFFIVVHKKKLIFLHWYHHISVLLYCWHSYVTKTPVGVIFCVMNYMVHSLMYFYYFLMAVKCKPKWLNALWITIAQISQMVVGVVVTVLGFIVYKQYAEEGCWITADNNLAAFVMYGSYLFLFLEFFVERYFLTSKRSQTQKKKIECGGSTETSAANGQHKKVSPAVRKTRRKED